MTAESIHGGGRPLFLRTTDGLRLRYGYWPAYRPTRAATVLLLGGRTEFLEKYGEVIGELTVRGYDVYGFDWRGQGLSDRLLADPRKCFVSSYDQYVMDLDFILHNLVYPRSRGPVVMLAHSMGAHVLLRYLDRDHHGIACAVLTAPMIDIRTHPLPPAWVRWLSRRMVQAGRESWNVPAADRHNPFAASFSRNRLTSDSVRFQRTRRFVARNPGLSSADVTFGWLAATFASIDKINAPSFGARIKVPVLMVLSGCDRVVYNPAARRLALQLPEVSIGLIAGARHEILQERDAFRKQFWAAFDGFAAPWKSDG